MTTEHAPLDVELSVAKNGTAAGYLVTLAVRGGDRAEAELGAQLMEVADDPTGDRAEPFLAVLDRRTPKSTREEIGTALFKGVVRDAVATLWDSVAEAAEQGRRVRVTLRMDPPMLKALPWELMRDGRWVFLRPGFTVWRFSARPRSGPPIEGPLRVLIVVCNPADRQVLGDDEVSRVARAVSSRLACTHVEIVDGPDRERLVREIDALRPHVLHFIGHGMPRVRGRPPALAFNWATTAAAASAPAPWELASDEVERVLPPEAGAAPRLVVVNACRTAEDPLDQVGGFAEAFLSAGAGAVVSMQADVESPAAALFAAALYEGIVQMRPLDQVVAAARTELARAAGDTGEWATPVLACRVDPGETLRVTFPRPAPLINELYARLEYRKLQNFLDHSDVRRDAWWALAPPWGDPRSLLVVGGRSTREGAQTGKTWFTHWCLLTYFLRGYRVTYVDLGAALRHVQPGRDKVREVFAKDWLDTLRVIRDAVTSDAQPEPLPASAFAGFNTTLNRLVDEKPREGPEDLWLPFYDDRPRADEYRDQILDAFREALRQAAAERPHVIALDNADRILDEKFKDAIYPGLIRPIAAQTGSATRLMLVASAEWLTGSLPPGDTDAPLWRPMVPIGDFDPKQAMRLARDYCGRNGYDFTALEPVFQSSLEVNPNVWVTRFDAAIVALGLAGAGGRR